MNETHGEDYLSLLQKYNGIVEGARSANGRLYRIVFSQCEELRNWKRYGKKLGLSEECLRKIDDDLTEGLKILEGLAENAMVMAYYSSPELNNLEEQK